jgi:hypothetical protein
MRVLFSTLMLALLSMPAYAEPNTVPEPQTLGLVAAGIAAAIWAGRRKK